MPGAGAAAGAGVIDARIPLANRDVRLSAMLAPTFDGIHEQGALLPRECMSAMIIDFRSDVLSAHYPVPSYIDWFNNDDLRPAYAWHQLVLQVLQRRSDTPRWVVKSPGHMAVLPSLLDRYPDANVVVCHRDPLEMLSSVTSLLATLRWAHAKSVDYQALAHEQADYYHRILDRLTDFRRDGVVDPARVFDVHYAALRRGPGRDGARRIRALRPAVRRRLRTEDRRTSRREAPGSPRRPPALVVRPRPRPRDRAGTLRAVPGILRRTLGGRVSHDVDKLLAELTLDEKAALTAGADLWSTVAVERLGIPRSASPTGRTARAARPCPAWHAGTSACVPCGSALGATWNLELVERVGAVLGDEARTKACRVLLAPTVNIHRSPLAGRNFECYSEDPLLSGGSRPRSSAACSRQGVATTVKHFVGNDAEFERMTINSVIDERTLREIYLVPFELAVREGGALGVMTAYNRLNGAYCAEHDELLARHPARRVGLRGLRDHRLVRRRVDARRGAAPGSTSRCPGPGRFYGPTLAEAVRRGEVDEVGRRRRGAPPAHGVRPRRRARRPAGASPSRSTGPSTARSRVTRPPESMVLLQATTTACCRSTPADRARSR